MYFKTLENWAFTVTKMSEPKLATAQTYDRFFDHIKHYVRVFKCIPEIAHGILHFHGMYECLPSLYRKNLLLHGFNVHFKKIYNESGWKSYCRKNIVIMPKKMPCLFKRDSNFYFIT